MDVKGGGQGEGQNGGDVADDATGAIFHRVVGSCFERSFFLALFQDSFARCLKKLFTIRFEIL